MDRISQADRTELLRLVKEHNSELYVNEERLFDKIFNYVKSLF